MKCQTYLMCLHDSRLNHPDIFLKVNNEAVDYDEEKMREILEPKADDIACLLEQSNSDGRWKLNCLIPMDNLQVINFK